MKKVSSSLLSGFANDGLTKNDTCLGISNGAWSPQLLWLELKAHPFCRSFSHYHDNHQFHYEKEEYNRGVFPVKHMWWNFLRK